jgi:hypothetical protein
MQRRPPRPNAWADDDDGDNGLAVDSPAWSPTPKQAEYLAASEFEVLYGGAAGGGKTDALVIDALGLWQDAVLHSDYKAIIFRPTYPELRELESRMREIYPHVYPGAEFNKTDHVWRFPSGAEIYTSYMQTEDDRFRWQSFEFQFIAFEELTQWPTNVPYVYMFSRLRTSNPDLKCVVRANCNPGGRGHKWVKERWGIGNDGGPTLSRQIVTLGSGEQRAISRRFIPALLKDNPYLGADYEATLLLLDEMQRRALLSGRWDVIEIPGAIYRREMEAAFFENRIGRVPHEPTLPVHTIWDLGVGDATAIWFCQLVGTERRLIDYYEMNGEGLPHYAKVLTDRRYNYGQHFAPHDIAVRELGTGRSRFETAAGLGIHFQITPNLSLEDGIHAARTILPTCYFDADKCARGVECLTNYRWEFSEKYGVFSSHPAHDEFSHGSDAFRYYALDVPFMNNSLNGWGQALKYPKLTVA